MLSEIGSDISNVVEKTLRSTAYLAASPIVSNLPCDVQDRFYGEHTTLQKIGANISYAANPLLYVLGLHYLNETAIDPGPLGMAAVVVLGFAESLARYTRSTEKSAEEDRRIEREERTWECVQDPQDRYVPSLLGKLLAIPVQYIMHKYDHARERKKSIDGENNE